MKKLKKKGKLAKTQEGEAVMVNERGEAVAADEVVIVLWNMCDGNVTSEDLVNVVVERTDKEKSQIDEPVKRVIKDLEKYGLLEKVG